MEGKLWIDEKTFQWVKVEATVVRPVSIEGFLAEVEPGTHFELEKAPVTDSIWLPKHFAMKSQRKSYSFSHASRKRTKSITAITNLRQLLQSALKDELAAKSSPAHPWQNLECSILTRQAFLGYSILCKSQPERGRGL